MEGSVPDNLPQDQPQPAVPLEYHKPTGNGPLVRRLLVAVIWLIMSSMIICYLVRVFRSP
jgi:hypothetical protein